MKRPTASASRWRWIGLVALATALTIGIGVAVSWRANAAPSGSPNPADSTRGSDPAAVRLTTVGAVRAGEFRGPEPVRRYRGEIRPRRLSDLSFRRSGIIESVRVRVGDRVTGGEVLATLNQDDVRAMLRMRRAELASAQSKLDEALEGPRRQDIAAAEQSVRAAEASSASALLEYKRQEDLRRSGAGSDRAFDRAKFDAKSLVAQRDVARQTLGKLLEGTRGERIDAARAAVEMASAAVAAAEVDLSDTRLVAAFDGSIAGRFVDEGTLADPRTPVVQIVECEPVEAVVAVPGEVADAVAVGDRLTIEGLDRNGRNETNRESARATPDLASSDPVSSDLASSGPASSGPASSDPVSSGPAMSASPIVGVVDRLGPVADGLLRTRDVYLRVDQVPLSRIGQPVSLRIPVRRFADGETDDDRFWVPTMALTRGVRGLWSVFVAVPTGAAADHRAGEPGNASEEVHAPGGMVAERRDVEVLQVAGDASLIRGDVARREWIVLAGAHRIGAGVPIRLASPADSSWDSPPANPND